MTTPKDHSERPISVDGNNPRYIVRPYARSTFVAFYAYDTITDNYIGIPFSDRALAQEKCNELNRLKDPH